MTRKDGEAFWILEKAHQTGHDAQGVSGPAKNAVADTNANAPNDARLVSGVSGDPQNSPPESGER